MHRTSENCVHGRTGCHECASLNALRDLAALAGSDPLLTHGSAGNCSCKVDQTLWIKASGKWMAGADDPDFVMALDLAEVRDCIAGGVDPVERYPGASMETSMHAVLPHAFVLHLHAVNVIAWAVRSGAAELLKPLLQGLNWCWIDCVPSGLPLARSVAAALARTPAASVFVLGNHGLVIGGTSAEEVAGLLRDVERKTARCPRLAHPADYAVLRDFSAHFGWDLPEDEAVHGLATDANARRVLAGGILFPAQAIVTGFRREETYHPVDTSAAGFPADRALAILAGIGVLYSPRITPPEEAMLSSLAQVVLRIPPGAPIRYLTDSELGEGLTEMAHRYRELANTSRTGVAAAD